MKKVKKKNTPQLNAKQEAFCREYVIDMNGTRAAIRAGYSKHTANEQAAQLLAKLSIKAKVAELTEKKVEKAEIDASRVLKEIARVAFTDMRKFYNEDGTIKEVHELDDDTAAALQAIEVDELYEGKKKSGKTRKLKMHNKISALESLARHLGLYQKDNEQSKNEAVIIYLPDDGRNKNA